MKYVWMMLGLMAGAEGLHAQNNITNTWSFVTTAPAGTCNQGQAWVLMPAGTLYTCQNGTPTIYGGGSGVTSVTCGTGLSGGTITATGTCAVVYTSPTAGTSISLTSAIAQMFVCTSTCTVTVPAPVAGAQYCIYNDNNVATVITLSAIGSSARYENTARTAYGTAATGTFVSGGAVGDAVCIVFRDSTHYSTLSHVGTWMAN